MDIDTLEGLKRCPLFKGFEDEEIINVMHTIRYRVVRCRKGEFYLYANTLCQHANIILEGEMVATLMSSSGKIVRMSTLEAGSILAPAFLFGADKFYPVTVEAAKNTSLLRILPTDMEQLLTTEPRLAMNFVRILSNIVAGLTKKVGLLSMSVRDKITSYLKEEQQRQRSNTIQLPLSRQGLANLFGIQKFSLIRCLKELQEEGAIKVDGKKIDILKL